MLSSEATWKGAVRELNAAATDRAAVGDLSTGRRDSESKEVVARLIGPHKMKGIKVRDL